MNANENQIVVYQPNETVRLDVRLENETVWLTQSQLCELFGVVKSNVSYHLKNIFGTNELDYGATVQRIRTVRLEAGRNVSRDIEYFNLDVIISLGYRINSKLGIQFRQWATRVLKAYLLQGYAVNNQLAQLEDKVDRRLAKHDSDIAELKEKVDFFVQTKEPPLQGVFYDGQLWDARALVLKLIQRAKRSLILIDNWATAETLDLFVKKRKGVKVTVFTSEHCDPSAFAQLLKWDEVKSWPGCIVGTMDYDAMDRIPGNTALARECRIWNEGYPNWWILSNIRRLPTPIPCCGNVGMWKLPRNLSVKIETLIPDNLKAQSERRLCK